MTGDGANRDPHSRLGREIVDRVNERAFETEFTIVMSRWTWAYLCTLEGWNSERLAFGISESLFPVSYEQIVTVRIDNDMPFNDYIISSRPWTAPESFTQYAKRMEALAEREGPMFGSLTRESLAKEMFENVKRQLGAFPVVRLPPST